MPSFGIAMSGRDIDQMTRIRKNSKTYAAIKMEEIMIEMIVFHSGNPA